MRHITATLGGVALALSSLVAMPAHAAINHYDTVCDLGSAPVGTSSANPYLIDDVYDLWETIDCSAPDNPDAWGVYFKLTADIEVPAAELVIASTASFSSPIGWKSDGSHLPFIGNFDGDGHTITADISTASQGSGLFSLVKYATFKNLTLRGSFSSASGTTGALASKSASAIQLENLTNFANVTGTSRAGLIGSVSGDANLVDVTNHGSMSGGSNVGGILGYVGGKITGIRVTNDGDITGSSYLGGVSGYSESDLFLRSTWNSGAISGTSGLVGGLVGEVDDGNVELYQVWNSGDVSGDLRVGGLIGSIDYDSSSNPTASVAMREVFNKGKVTGTGQLVGGIAGYAGSLAANVLHAETSRPLDVYNSGEITADMQAGGIFGNIRQLGQWDHVYSSGAIASTGYGDGLIGNTDDADEPPLGISTVVSAYNPVENNPYTLSQLQDIATYDGWDFETVWGFGPCDYNNGLPILRFAQEVETYSAEACIPVATSAAPPVYDGPTLRANELPVSPGDTVKLPGTKLGSVSNVLIAGATAVLVSKSDAFIEIIIPKVENGVVDLSLDSDWGRLTVQSALRVLAAEELVADGAFNAWTKYFPDNTVRIYARNVIGVGKLQYFHNGREIAWIRAEEADESKLNILSDGFLRWVNLAPGRNVFEIYLDGVRIERRIATVR